MEEFRKELICLIKDLRVPGAIISIRSEIYDNMDIFHGYANLKKKIRMTDDILFPIGSITKTFTGTIFLQAYDEGLVDLNDPVSDYFVGIPNGENITVRQIGNMRSGLFNYTESPIFQQVAQNNPYRNWSPMELISVGLTNPPYFPPDTDFHYSNTNTIILAGILERIYARNYEKLLHERIFSPLRLTNTEYSPVLPPDAVTGYIIKNGKYIPTTGYNSSNSWAAGEIISNVNDMHHYAKKNIMMHKTISKFAVREQRNWQSSEITDQNIMKYGFQMLKLNNYIGHNGTLPGFSSYLLCNIKSQTSIVIMCNIQQNENGIIPANQLANIVVNTLPGW